MGAYKTLQESSRLERAVRTVNELQDLLANHARALKEGKPEVPAEVAALREKAQELRRVMRTEDTLTDLQHQLETGDFKHTVTPFVEPISPEVERMQIAVKRARRDIRMAIEEMRPKTKLQRVESGLNFLRTMKATADVSYALRQGAASVPAGPDSRPRRSGRRSRPFSASTRPSRSTTPSGPVPTSSFGTGRACTSPNSGRDRSRAAKKRLCPTSPRGFPSSAKW